MCFYQIYPDDENFDLFEVINKLKIFNNKQRIKTIKNLKKTT